MAAWRLNFKFEGKMPAWRLNWACVFSLKNTRAHIGCPGTMSRYKHYTGLMFVCGLARFTACKSAAHGQKLGLCIFAEKHQSAYRMPRYDVPVQALYRVNVCMRTCKVHRLQVRGAWSTWVHPTQHGSRPPVRPEIVSIDT
ncbi:hypothetical protein DFH28DRAFT_928564 [Melampsora americana]|nr:hypothetical protein DFH28DRAFT_928564 [Melampsora americana]